MKILELELVTADLEAQRQFYVEVLGLKMLEFGKQHLTVQVGSSRLKLTLQTAFTGRYHFAFDVPENQLLAAKNWLKTRAELIADVGGETIFESTNWNANMVYFRDPQGNILELIARHDLQNSSDAKFSSSSFINISEIGLACDDVPEVASWLAQHLNLKIYKSSSDIFAPIGDAHGLLILVQNAREWFPSTGVFATPQPVTVQLESDQNQRLELPNLPYKIERKIP